MLHYKFIIQFAGEKISKIGETFSEAKSKMVDRVVRPIRLILLFSKMHNSPDRSNTLRTLDDTVNETVKKRVLSLSRCARRLQARRQLHRV